MLHKLQSNQHQVRYLTGFGLVELMVSISVMVIVTSVILAKHGSYNGASLLRGQAYELALSIREMQQLAVSATLATTTGYRNTYGIVISSSTDSTYVLFRDADGDYFYDVGEEFGPLGVIDGRFVISRVELIGPPPHGGLENSVTILFERPNFDALLYEGSNNPVDASISGVEIDVRLKGVGGSGPNTVRTLEVTRAGQIAVKNL